MAPKAQKTPTTGGKAPAGKAPAEKKEAGKKTAAPSGDKKKRTKTRKETYSSYIYKGVLPPCSSPASTSLFSRHERDGHANPKKKKKKKEKERKRKLR